MAPLVPLFSASSLPEHVNTIRRNFHEEKRRKGDPVELSNCPLFEMVQYSCNPPQEGIPQPGVIVCKPVVRLFRRYTPLPLLQDTRRGWVLIWMLDRCAGLTVETTAWEPLRVAEDRRKELE